MRIYISGKITGVVDYLEQFDRAENFVRLEHKTSKVINPAKINALLPSEMKHREYMHVCFALLDLADAIYMMPGWEESKGACMEYGYAKATGKEIFLPKAAYIDKDFEKAVRKMECEVTCDNCKNADESNPCYGCVAGCNWETSI